MIKKLHGRLLPLFVKKRINNNLCSRGYIKKRNIPPVDFRKLVEHPIEALHRSNFCPVLVDVPLDRCRGLSLMAFSCSSDSNHPFIATIRDFMRGDVMHYRGSKLEKYYANFQPSSGIEYLGLAGENLHASFLQSPLWITEPWFGVPSVNEETRKTEIMHLEGNKSMSSGGSEDIRAIYSKEWNFFGPLSFERGAVEFDRLIAVAESIMDIGYVRNDRLDGDITGNLLIRDDGFSVTIGAGQHRVCALAANNYTEATVRFKAGECNIIRREDAGLWPGVKYNLFTVTQAQAVFDRVFDGHQPNTYYKR